MGKVDLSKLNDKQREAVLHISSPLAIMSVPGCITGDTIINFNRCKKGFSKSILEAYSAFNQSVHAWDLTKPTYVRSYVEGTIKLNEIDDIVYSGEKQIYKLILENGLFIKATSDHRIMTNAGFIELCKLKNYHKVMCDTLHAHSLDKTNNKRRDNVISGVHYHPYGHKHGLTLRLEEYRLAYEAGMNNISLSEFIEILKTDMQRAKKLKFLSKKYEVHHVDENHENNHVSNLISVTPQDHDKLHRAKEYKKFNQGVPVYVKIKSRKKLGIENTYDIQCRAPFNNFVANGIVIHNSGKTSTITKKIEYLVNELDYNPRGIWACTFTNKAANEMKDRLKVLIGDKADKLKIKTLHGTAFRILKYLKQRKDPTWKAPKIMVNNMAAFFHLLYFIKNEKFGVRDTNQYLKSISHMKLNLIGVDKCKAHNQFTPGMGSYNEALYKVYEKYEQYLAKTNQMDFNDILLNCYNTLYDKSYSEDVERLRSTIDYLLVDECIPYNTRIFVENCEIHPKIGTLYRKYKNNEPLPKVLSYCKDRDKLVYKQIKKVFKNSKKSEILQVTLGKSKIKCTLNHKIKTNKGWVSANKLSNGDLVMMSTIGLCNGIVTNNPSYKSYWYAPITYIKKLNIENQNMYDLEVEDTHNYGICNDYKSKSCTIIHNCQDTNKASFEILNKLISNRNCFTVVGDLKQLIFSFQSASLEHSSEFIKKHNPKIIDLNINYRSTKTIVNSSNALISHAKGVTGSNAVTPNPVGSKIKYITHGSSEEEGEVICDLVGQLVANGEKYKDITILYRVHSQTREIEDMFMLNNIPYIIFSKGHFYLRKEVKDILTYIEIVSDLDDINLKSLKRIANRPTRYLSNKTIDKFDDLCFEADYTLWDGLKNIYSLDLPSREQDALDKLYKSLHLLGVAYKRDLTTSELINYILKDLGYKEWAESELLETNPEQDVQLNLDALLTSVSKFPSPKLFLNFVDETLKKEKEKKKNEDGNFVKMMTVHRAKGSENKHIIIVGVCDRLFPFFRAVDEGNEEEEKRIMYVAQTRPKEELYLSIIDGKLGNLNVGPSPYLKLMDIGYNGGSNV